MKSLITVFLFFILNPFLFAQSSEAENFIEITPSYTFPVKPFPNPEFQFVPPVNLKQAGDINRDGVMDFYNVGFESTMYWYGSEELSLYPDFVENTLDIPIGDINGDGEADKIIYEDSSALGRGQYVGTLEVASQKIFDFDLFNGMNYLKTLSTYDFDGDGFQDVLLHNLGRTLDESLGEVYMLWGAENTEDIELQLTNLSLLDSLERRDEYNSFFYLDLDGDMNKELITVFRVDGDFGTDLGISIFKINNDRSFTLLQHFRIPYFSINTLLMTAFTYDYDSDGEMDLFISSEDGTLKLDLGDEQGELLEDDSFSDSFRGEEHRIFYDFLIPIGDFDGNDQPDFLKIPASNQNFVYEVVELSGTAGFINPVSVYNGEDGRIRLTFNLFPEHRNIDINKDRLHDLTFSFGRQDDNDQVTRRLVLGNQNRENFSTKEAFFNDEFDYIGVQQTYHAGDLNNDGIDDFAILKRPDYYLSTLDIYYGGKNTYSSPDFTISSEGTSYFEDVIFGDFNGDSFGDIITLDYVTEFTNSVRLNYNRLSYYKELSSTDTPDQVLDYEAISGHENHWSGNSFSTSYAGDIDGDQNDDLVFSITFEGTTNTHILFGGDDLTTTDRLVIDFEANNYAYIGDIDQDGTDNFALVNTNYWSQNGDTAILGLVRIYSAFDDISSFNPDDYTDIIMPLTPSAFGQRTGNLYFGYFIDSGDLNGDGIPDLLVGSYESKDQNVNFEGTEAFFVYYGGSFSGVPDYSFPIPISLVSNDDYETTFQYLSRFRSRSVSIIPDIDSNGTDEILFLATSSTEEHYSNGLIFRGTKIDTINYTNPIVLKSPVEYGVLGTSTKQLSVGNYNSTNGLDFILRKGGDYRQLGDPVYLYEISPRLLSSENESEVSEFKLHQNYPNPFNPTTEIGFALPKASKTSLTVFNILGQKVAVLVNENLTPGNYTFTFDAQFISSGIYFYTLETENSLETKKMLLIK